MSLLKKGHRGNAATSFFCASSIGRRKPVLPFIAENCELTAESFADEEIKAALISIGSVDDEERAM